jgi:hypothetical protein
MCCAPPELPEPDTDFWNSPLFSPLPSQMQKVLDAICMSDLVANGDEPKNYFHDVVPSQYGTNDLTTYNSELWGPMPNNPDGSLGNDPSSQKKLAFGCETIKNMESVMDDGSRSAVNAKMLNALVSIGCSQCHVLLCQSACSSRLTACVFYFQINWCFKN